MDNQQELQQVISQSFNSCKKKMDIFVKDNFMLSLEKLGFPGGRIDIIYYNDLDVSDKKIADVLSTIDAYKLIKNSKYYSEFDEWDEDVQKDSIACSASAVKSDVPVFLSELLNNLGYKVADIEIKESKGCLGLFVLFAIVCLSPTISLFL